MPFSTQEITLLQAKLKEEFDSGPLWVNGALSSILSEGTLPQVEGDTTVDSHLDPLLPSFNDVEDVDSVVSAINVPYDIHPEDLYVDFVSSPSPPTVITDCSPSLIM